MQCTAAELVVQQLKDCSPWHVVVGVGLTEICVQMRTEVNAITTAFDGAATRLQAAKNRNAEAQAVLDLCKRLDQGSAITADIASLAQSSGDAVVQAAVDSLPGHAAIQGVVSTDELVHRWGRVRRAVRVHMGISDDKHAGFLSMSLASLSSALKVRLLFCCTRLGAWVASLLLYEGVPVNVADLVNGLQVSEWASASLGQERTPEAQLAAVDVALRERDLKRALSVLEQLAGSMGATHVVTDFMDALKARAIADQAAMLLHAHQTVLSTVWQPS